MLILNRLQAYRTLIFDCDGVILNSNHVKTEAFRHAVLPYGESCAAALVDYHVTHGGISRYEKFSYFLKNIVPKGVDGPNLDELLSRFSKAVLEGLWDCEVALGLYELRKQMVNTRWLIVSGGDQQELRGVFMERGLDDLFNGGIYGSPDTKYHIVQRELFTGNIITPALFLGDSRLDHEVASSFGFDFVFVNQWTEFSGWRDYCELHKIDAIKAPMKLMWDE